MTLTMARRSVTFDVLGIAQPKGSTRAFVPKSWAQAAAAAGTAPRAIVTGSNRRAKDWQHRIATEAQKVAQDGLFVGPVALEVVFFLPRPKSAPKRVTHPTTAPDLDKLLRCLGDALTGVLYTDDSQVVDIQAMKRYTPQAASAHAAITVAEAVPPEPKPLELFV